MKQTKEICLKIWGDVWMYYAKQNKKNVRNMTEQWKLAKTIVDKGGEK
jgi:hypothetical protein